MKLAQVRMQKVSGPCAMSSALLLHSLLNFAYKAFGTFPCGESMVDVELTPPHTDHVGGFGGCPTEDAYNCPALC